MSESLLGSLCLFTYQFKDVMISISAREIADSSSDISCLSLSLYKIIVASTHRKNLLLAVGALSCVALSMASTTSLNLLLEWTNLFQS